MRATCVLVELVDGQLLAFDFHDQELAEQWLQECRTEWNAQRMILFRTRSTGLDSAPLFHPDDVSHLERTSREDAVTRGAEVRGPAFIQE